MLMAIRVENPPEELTKWLERREIDHEIDIYSGFLWIFPKQHLFPRILTRVREIMEEKGHNPRETVKVYMLSSRDMYFLRY